MRSRIAKTRVTQKAIWTATWMAVAMPAPIPSPTVPPSADLDQADQHADQRRDEAEQQLQQPLPGQVVGRADELQPAVGVAGGELLRVAQLGEHLPLGGGGVLAAGRPALDHVLDRGAQLGGDLLAARDRHRAQGRGEVSVGQGGHRSAPSISPVREVCTAARSVRSRLSTDSPSSLVR